MPRVLAEALNAAGTMHFGQLMTNRALRCVTSLARRLDGHSWSVVTGGGQMVDRAGSLVKRPALGVGLYRSLSTISYFVLVVLRNMSYFQLATQRMSQDTQI